MGEGPESTPSRVTPAPLFLTQHYCNDCYAPCGMTDRGPLCGEHYGAHAIVCESCGLRPADIVEYGYYVCCACKNGGRA